MNFAVVYACGMINGKTSSQSVWIFGRNRTLQQEYITKSLEALKTSKIVFKSLVSTSQNNCSVPLKATTKKTDNVTTTAVSTTTDDFFND